VRRAESEYVDSHEDAARSAACELNTDVTVRVGGVMTRPQGESFTVTGAIGDAIVSFDVVIRPGSKGREYWSLWCLKLSSAGLCVKEDDAYAALAFAEAAREEEWMETGMDLSAGTRTKPRAVKPRTIKRQAPTAAIVAFPRRNGEAV